jgi:ATP synthase protein I
MRIPAREPQPWARHLSTAAIGIEMGAALVVGIAIGWFLDRSFGTAPWCLAIFTVFGIVAGFRNLIVAARRALEKEDGR